jgi:hypothetical protein
MENCEENKVKRIIFEKNDMTVISNKKNEYTLKFDISNKNIYLKKIINIHLATLVYELNKEDICEDYKLEIINDSEAKIYCLFKHFFKDLGFSQKYFSLNFTIREEKNRITFIANTNTNNTFVNMNNNIEVLPIDYVIFNFFIINDHLINFESTLWFNNTFEIPLMLEKLASNIFLKIFIRVKQFIENIK